MAEKREYTESERVSAVKAYVVHGGLRAAGEALGIPWETIAGWRIRYREWWDQKQSEVSLKLLESLTEASQHKALVLREICLEVIEDRLKDGDHKLNMKTGLVERVKISAVDVTKVFTALGGSMAKPRADEAPLSDEDRMLELAKLAEEDRAGRSEAPLQ